MAGERPWRKNPKAAAAPPLIDNGDAQEIFVTDVVGAGVIGGCISINLATHRWTPTEKGKDPEISRTLAARLILSRDAAMQLAQTLTGLGGGNRPAQKAQAEVRPTTKK